MFVTALLITLSVAWLTWRAVQLWTLPLTVVLRHLQIEIPSAPRLTIDALDPDSVSLHWAPSESHVKRHIIYTNGQEVGVSTKGETSVRISGLLPDHLYSIQVVAVNAHGFQMASAPTHVRTKPELQPEANEKRTSCTPHVQPIVSPTIESSAPTRLPRKRNSFDPKAGEPTTNTSHLPKLPDSQRRIDDLTTRMESLNKETADVDTQIAQLAQHHAQEEATLNKKLEQLRTKKKEEDEAKSLRDQQHKHLDQQKREVESKRNQVQKALKVEQDALHRQTTDIASFRSSVQNSIETVDHLEQSMRTLHTDTDEAITAAQRASSIASEELSEVESEIRYLLSRKTEAEGELAKLMDNSRESEPTSQEVAEWANTDAAWKEREASLIKQYEEAQLNLVRLQNSIYVPQEVRGIATSGVEPAFEHPTSMRRKVSRRGRADDQVRTNPGHTAFNPDAAPFVASNSTYTSSESNPLSRPTSSPFGFNASDQYTTGNTFTSAQEASFPVLRSNYQSGLNHASSSIFSDEPSLLRSSSPFVRRGSNRSSQSGSNPPSPAIQNRPALPSIFNTASAAPARNSSSSLVDRLNGTPLDEITDSTPALNKDGSKWFWPTRKKTGSDSLILDRKNTRSLPKADVAPIGTRRNRSGSLREETNSTKVSPAPVSNGYHDVDILNAIGHPLSRETSVEKDNYSTSAVPLPRPSHSSAFGWESQVPSSQRRLINPWRGSDHQVSSAARPFDPFGDLPVPEESSDQGSLQVPSRYHTTIDASRLANLDRAISNGSKKSSKSKTESHDSKDKIKLLGDTKFSSFVGRVFGKNAESGEMVPESDIPTADDRDK